MFRFIHAADIHLDSPLRGLERYEGVTVEEIRRSTRRALENLVELAIEEHVDFVLIAGDLYDGNWPDYSTGLYLNAQMARLRDAHIPVFLIQGNHDAENLMTRDLRLPENVHKFSTLKPQTIPVKDCDVLVHGQGFATVPCGTTSRRVTRPAIPATSTSESCIRVPRAAKGMSRTPPVRSRTCCRSIINTGPGSYPQTRDSLRGAADRISG